MRIETRLVVALAALTYCVFVAATLIRHRAGTPSVGMSWLLLAPIVGCACVGLALGLEQALSRRGPQRGYAARPVYARPGLGAPEPQDGAAPARRRPQGELVRWRAVPLILLCLYFFGFGLMTWRSIWMFFSWDGMYLFPAWLMIAATLIRWHPRWVPCD